MDNLLFWIVPASSVLALVFAYYFYRQMLRESEGTERMAHIAAAVRREYPKLPSSKVTAKTIGRALVSLGFEGRHTRRGTCYTLETCSSMI